jgi:hemoglobin/transferrin/lactoferrin receptor protein
MLRSPSAPATCAALLALAMALSPAAADTSVTPQTSPDPDQPLNREPYTLDEIIVTATRSPATRFSTPYLTESISSDLIQDRAYRSLPQALRDIPGIFIQETSPSQGSPFIRGFTGRDNLLLIDGIRLNNATNRSGPMQYWNTVDPLSLDRIEVVKGPSSVLYGSDAVGGTVNAITLSPWTYAPGFQSGARGYYRYASAENSNIFSGALSTTFDQTAGLLFQGSAKDLGDITAGSSTHQPETGYDEYDTHFKAEYNLDPDVKLILAHQRVRQNNASRTHRTIFAVPFQGTTIGSDRRLDYDQERQLTYLQLHAQNIDSPLFDTFRASLSWQEASEVEDRIRSNNAQSLRGFDVGTLGLWAQFESDSPIGRLTYGLDYYRDSISSFASNNPIQGPVADDSTYDLLGLFIQDQIDLTDRLHLSLGARFTYAAADADKVQDPTNPANTIQLSDEWTDLTGSARLVYDLIPDHLNLFAGVSQAFRAPNIEDLTSLNISLSGQQAIPSPGLDPEHYLVYEVGSKLQTDRIAFETAFFYYDISDAITTSLTGDTLGGLPTVAKSNAGSGFMQGIEMGTAWEFMDQFTLFGNIAYVDGDVDGDYPSKIPPIHGQVGIRWEAPQKKFWAEVQGVFAGQGDRLSASDRTDTQRIPPGGTPSWAILNLRAGWRVIDQVEIFGAIENVADANYRVHGSGSNSPGRNFIAGVQVAF